MNRSTGPAVAAERSRWLAELAQAVGQAQRLARILGIPEGNCAEGNEIFGRLESIRIEVESLRRGSRVLPQSEVDPLWTNLFPWQGRHKV